MIGRRWGRLRDWLVLCLQDEFATLDSIRVNADVANDASRAQVDLRYAKQEKLSIDVVDSKNAQFEADEKPLLVQDTRS